MMNILLTSVGRRGYLVNYFKNAIQPKGRVIAANSEALTSGMIVADKSYTVPRVNSVDYISKILEICQVEDIGMVVSLFDIDLPYLAKAHEQFVKAGVHLVISNPWVIEIANDKWKTYTFLSERFLATPKTYKNIQSFEKALYESEIKFPVIVKPRWGMGSLSVYKAENIKDVRFFIDYCKRAVKSSYLNIISSEIEESILVQEYISGREFGIDVFNDLQANKLTTVVKEKIGMRAGETDVAIVVNNPEVRKLAESVGENLKHVGNLDIDILLDKKNVPYVLEFNARFGGGYPFSHLAGVDFPKLLVQMANGSELDKNLLDFKLGIKGMKFIEPTQI